MAAQELTGRRQTEWMGSTRIQRTGSRDCATDWIIKGKALAQIAPAVAPSRAGSRVVGAPDARAAALLSLGVGALALEHGGGSSFVRLLAPEIVLHPLDLLLKRNNARLQFADRQRFQVLAQGNARWRSRFELIPIHCWPRWQIEWRAWHDLALVSTPGGGPVCRRDQPLPAGGEHGTRFRNHDGDRN